MCPSYHVNPKDFSMARAVRQLTLRAVPIWLLRQYLEQLGAYEVDPPAPGAVDPDGVVRADGAMDGDGWSVLWRTEHVQMHPRLRTTMEEHYFTFSAASEAAVEELIDRFMLKAQRGGG